jgi:hypothetical protein
MMTDSVKVDGVVTIPPHKWYEFIDKMTRIDDLIEVLIKQVDRTNMLIEGIYRAAGITPPSTQAGLVLIDCTTTPLPPRGIWVSAVDSDPMTEKIVGTVYSDTRGVVCVEQSADGENWDVVTSFEVLPPAQRNSFGFSVEKIAQYARVRYIDAYEPDTGAQSKFRLYVYAKKR